MSPPRIPKAETAKSKTAKAGTAKSKTAKTGTAKGKAAKTETKRSRPSRTAEARTAKAKAARAARDPPAPRQGYEPEEEVELGTTVNPPSGVELAESVADIVGELANSG
ncbi:MAG TPA: hypothetical protein VNU28_03375, partial [Solirubrobacteraceae bacterium]|nr:hypothetical protein [Solirubrobacteraceae bacterium]